MDYLEILGEITGTVSAANESLKALSEVIGSGKGRAELAEDTNQLITLRQYVLDLQGEHSAMRDSIRELETEIQRMKAFRTEEKNKYQLRRPDGSAFVYMLRIPEVGSGGAHWLCATCFQQDRKSILQPRDKPRQLFQAVTWGCDVCKSTFQVCNQWDKGPASRPIAAISCGSLAMNETSASGVLATCASVTILPFSSRTQTAVLASDTSSPI